MLYPFFFAVSASDANGRSAQQYVRDAFLNGYTVPPSNGYGSVPGAGYQFAAGFEAACAAMGAMAQEILQIQRETFLSIGTTTTLLPFPIRRLALLVVLVK